MYLKKHNKLSKYTPLQTKHLRGTALSGRPLARRYIGAVIPYVFFIGFFQEHGINFPEFLKALFVNGAAGGFSADLLFTSFVFWLFMFVETKKQGPSPYLFIVLNLTIGLSCALPAYLYAKEKLREKNI